MENTQRQTDFRRQLITLLAGALIGFIPTAALTVYQAHQQRNQFLLDRQLSALRDFSAVVSGGGELMSAVSELEVGLHHLDHLDPRARTVADWQRVDSLYKVVIDRRYKWASEVNAQAVMTQALFPASADPRECRTSGNTLMFSKYAEAQRPPLAGPEEQIAFMKENVSAFKKKLAVAIDSTQMTIRCHAAHLTE